MEFTLSGEVAQVVNLKLTAGETVWAARGSIVSYDEAGLNWTMKVHGGAGAAVGRMFAGEGITLIYLEAKLDTTVTLGANSPGKVAVWDLEKEGPVLATRGAFLCACGPEVEIVPTITRRVGVAFFGGAGLILQKVIGRGIAFVHGAGDFLEYTLESGQSIQVSTGNLAAFSESCDYQIKSVGGCGKMIFSGEGIFMSRITGPGKVLIQSLKRTAASRSRGGAYG